MQPLPFFRSRRVGWPLGLVAGAGLFLTTPPAFAVDPVLRHQEDTTGDVVVFGSTLGFDCGAGLPAPPGATASCAGQTLIDDTAPDLYFRDNLANATILPKEARTSATLSLPPGATVTYARLYWAALKDGADPDLTATLDWLGGPQQEIVADDSWVISYGFPSHPTWYYYQATGDATDFVATWGAGDFRVSDVDAIPLANIEVDRAFSAWTLVVFYEQPNEELRNLALFDGFTGIDPGIPGMGAASVNLSGFLVPQGFTAKMAAFTYEGDALYNGDHFTFNGGQQQDNQNPFDNFFNSSRSYLGQPFSGNFDVPEFSGAAGTMAGYDLDTVDVTELVSAGDTSAVVGADSSYDIFFLGGFATSVTNLAPHFKVTKTFEDLNGGAVSPGDELEFIIHGKNVGNDTAKNVHITDTIGAGMHYVAGSMEITLGGSEGAKTDASGDDQGDWQNAIKKVTLRVGEGADADFGGTVAPGASVEVRFRVQVTAQSGDILTNQAKLIAEGQSGAPEKEYLSDGDPGKVGDQPTTIPVDQCTTNAECPEDLPHCNTETHVCEGCQSDADCPDPTKPACQPNGTCGECSATNQTLCIDEKPICDTGAGICVLCTLGPDGDASACEEAPEGPICVAGEGSTVHCGCLTDADCGNTTSGLVCDPATDTCIEGCRAEGGNGCPNEQECSSTDSSIGTCGPGDKDPTEQGPCACSVPGDTRPGALGLFAAAAALATAFGRRATRRK